MSLFLQDVVRALLTALAMFWQVFWSLVLGFVLSGVVQALVPKEKVRRLLGGDGPREIALAAVFGAASSSCSYAAAALSKSLFSRGAGFIASLAFLFASTNLVIELGIVLYVLLGWQFTLAQWAGGALLVAIMAAIVRLTYPAHLIEEARAHAASVSQVHGHGHHADEVDVQEVPPARRLRDPATLRAVAAHTAADVAMLWPDLLVGFLVAGALVVFVPAGVWNALFLHGSGGGAAIVGNALIGPLIAMISFVCSIGNVPMAAALWASGISFGGVIAFLYADLLVVPLLDVYRRAYGLKMAAYMTAVLYVSMVLAALLVEVIFRAAHVIPNVRPAPAAFGAVAFDATFWLNVLFGALALCVVWLNRQHAARAPSPEDGHAECCH
ncbi:MAG TPA: permease [Candidatus Acidoferrales bacterium]|nr:permease [Candidatus Acidoferrales bacterium]